MANISGAMKEDMAEFNRQRYTQSSTANRTVTVYRFTTTPTDSSEPLFRVEVLTAKEAAIEEIMAQPFYAPNA